MLFTLFILSLAMMVTAVTTGLGQEPKGRILVVRKSTTMDRDFSTLRVQTTPSWLATVRVADADHGLYRVASNILDNQELLQQIKLEPDVLAAFPEGQGFIPKDPTSEQSVGVQDAPQASTGWFLGTTPYTTIHADVAAAVISSQVKSQRGPFR